MLLEHQQPINPSEVFKTFGCPHLTKGLTLSSSGFSLFNLISITPSLIFSAGQFSYLKSALFTCQYAFTWSFCCFVNIGPTRGATQAEVCTASLRKSRAAMATRVWAEAAAREGALQAEGGQVRFVPPSSPSTCHRHEFWKAEHRWVLQSGIHQTTVRASQGVLVSAQHVNICSNFTSVVSARWLTYATTELDRGRDHGSRF